MGGASSWGGIIIVLYVEYVELIEFRRDRWLEWEDEGRNLDLSNSLWWSLMDFVCSFSRSSFQLCTGNLVFADLARIMALVAWSDFNADSIAPLNCLSK